MNDRCIFLAARVLLKSSHAFSWRAGHYLYLGHIKVVGGCCFPACERGSFLAEMPPEGCPVSWPKVLFLRLVSVGVMRVGLVLTFLVRVHKIRLNTDTALPVVTLDPLSKANRRGHNAVTEFHQRLLLGTEPVKGGLNILRV